MKRKRTNNPAVTEGAPDGTSADSSLVTQVTPAPNARVPVADRPPLQKCKYKYATVCSSNVNRSMEAHKRLKEKAFNVASFGVGTQVRMPGKRRGAPTLFNFGTRYSAMLEYLRNNDEKFFRSKGLIDMLERNEKIKDVPHRWQETRTKQFAKSTTTDIAKSTTTDGTAPKRPGISNYNVIICFEERVFDILIEDLHCRLPESFTTLHIINIDTRDNHQASIVSGANCLELCYMCEEAQDLDVELPDIIETFQRQTNVKLLYQQYFV